MAAHLNTDCFKLAYSFKYFPTGLTSEAPLPPCNNLLAIERLIVNLHTWNTSLKVASIVTGRSHPYGLSGWQAETTNSSCSHESIADEESGDAGFFAVCSAYECPFTRTDTAACNITDPTPASSRHKSRKKFPWPNHPEVHPPAFCLVVEDRSLFAFVVDPG